LKPKKLKNNQAKPGKNRAKPEKIKSNLKNQVNQFEPVFVLKNQTETGRFEPVSVFFKNNNNFGLVAFLL